MRPRLPAREGVFHVYGRARRARVTSVSAARDRRPAALRRTLRQRRAERTEPAPPPLAAARARGGAPRARARAWRRPRSGRRAGISSLPARRATRSPRSQTSNARRGERPRALAARRPRVRTFARTRAARSGTATCRRPARARARATSEPRARGVGDGDGDGDGRSERPRDSRRRLGGRRARGARAGCAKVLYTRTLATSEGVTCAADRRRERYPRRRRRSRYARTSRQATAELRDDAPPGAAAPLATSCAIAGLRRARMSSIGVAAADRAGRRPPPRAPRGPNCRARAELGRRGPRARVWRDGAQGVDGCTVIDRLRHRRGWPRPRSSIRPRWRFVAP